MLALRVLPLALLLLGCAAGHGRGAPDAPPPVAPPPPLTVADIAARVLPSVVTIRTAQSLGTGFVVRSDGWIATNLHVIVGGPHVKVRLRDEREFDVVEVLAVSPEYDLALVRVEARGLHAVALGDSDAMRAGDPVVAIGNPMGLEDTVSNGLVSARRRMHGLEILQVSAPIAPGSSGGPLLDQRGEVIGIATAVLDAGQNLNFGVPARYLVPMLRKPEPMPFAEFATLIAGLRKAAQPKTDRNIPHHPLSVLDGCSSPTQKLVVRLLGDAIEAGAPLYNHGKPAACYQIYYGAASDLAQRLPASCKGPAKALADAQHHAAGLGDESARAWVMRDAFDGLLDVIARKQDE
jgi:serine protease Do